MKRGRKPEPTASLKLKGSWRANLRDGEPELGCSDVEKPDWLPDEAEEHWHETCACLKGMGVLNPVYRNAIALYATLLADWEVVQHVKALKNGSTKDPAWVRRMDVLTKIERWSVQLGLTPSSITGVKTTSDKSAEKRGLDRFKSA